MKTYRNVADLVHDVSEDKAIGSEVADNLRRQAIVHMLFGMRSARGVSQMDMATKLGCSQSRVSKLENSEDDDLTIGELRRYLRALDHDIMFVTCKGKWSLVEQIKFHACAIRESLVRMVELAKGDSTIRDGVTKFHVEAFFNLVQIVLASARNLPESSAPIPAIVETDDDCPYKEPEIDSRLALS